MNRSLLLIICDFLLISILALVDFDAPEPPEPEEVVEVERTRESIQEDLMEALQASLESEEERRRRLEQEVAAREEELSLKEDLLSEREEQVALTEAEKRRVEEQKRRLEEEREKALEELYSVRNRLDSAEQERAMALMSLEEQAERARLLQETIRDQQKNIDQASSRIANLEDERTGLVRNIQLLETDLKVTETEKSILKENLVASRAEIETVRVEKQQAEQRATQLAEGVTQLAENSVALREEIREAQPLTMNQIFAAYENNLLQVEFQWKLGRSSRVYSSSTRSLVLRYGGNYVAIFETSNTPFEDADTARLSAVIGRFTMGGTNYRIRELSFLEADPDIAYFRLPDADVEATDLVPFEIAQEPLRFPEMVLVGVRGRGEKDDVVYGETAAKLVPGGYDYFEVDRTILSALFGDFSARRGDVMFSKSGEILGFMVERDLAALIRNLDRAAEIRIDVDFLPEKTQEVARLLEGMRNQRPR